jgi:4-amino-4-deoxy-L-arabinose transferase-like glycosyltransferase
MTDQMRRALFTVLILCGSFLRLYQLDQYPLGVHQDELSNIYDGWSIATTGADRYGDMYPGVVRAFGERDYRPSMVAWLTAIPQKFTGFSIVSGRLAGAILGILSLFLVYWFAREMAGEGYAMLALLLTTLSPLHIQFSRIAHEGAIFPAFFMILALCLWHKAATSGFRLLHVALLGLTIGASTNVYQSTRLTGALLIVAIAIDVVRHSKIRLKPIFVLGAFALIGALPQIVFLITEPARFAGRAGVLSVTADNPFTYMSTVLTNAAMNLDPRYLFVPPFLRGLTVARLIPAEAPFFYAGLVALAFLPVKAESRGRKYLYIALLLTLLPSAITLDPPATMRTSPISVIAPFFSAAGIVMLARLIRNEVTRRRIYYPAVVGALVIAAFGVTYRYAQSEYFRELSFQELGVRMGTALGRHEKQYDAIVVEPHVSQAYLYIAAFSPISPEEFHRLPKRLFSVGMDKYTQMGKYHFVTESMMKQSIDSLRGRGRVLFVTSQKMPGLSLVDSVTFRDDALYFETY